jgi:hypothetical protein
LFPKETHTHTDKEKVEGTVHPVTSYEGTEGDRGIALLFLQLYAFLHRNIIVQYKSIKIHRL